MKKKGTVWFALGALCIAAALLLTVCNFREDTSAGNASEEALNVIIGEIENAKAEEPEPTPTPVFDEDDILLYETPEPTPVPEMPIVNVDGSDYVAVISIPSVELELPVQNEWSYENLQISPCRYTGNVYSDDMVICAHNYRRHFGMIKDLEQGTEVIVLDMEGNVFRYTVAEVETLTRKQYYDMTIPNQWDLTLFTCTIGGRTRVTVRCVRE